MKMVSTKALLYGFENQQKPLQGLPGHSCFGIPDVKYVWFFE